MADNVDFSVAVRAGDKFANDKVMRGRSMLIKRNAGWRMSPATASQISTLEKRIKSGMSDDMKLRLTKGEAADILTKFMNGFKKRIEKEQKIEAKKLLSIEKKRKHQVKIGPL